MVSIMVICLNFAEIILLICKSMVATVRQYCGVESKGKTGAQNRNSKSNIDS